MSLDSTALARSTARPIRTTTSTGVSEPAEARRVPEQLQVGARFGAGRYELLHAIARGGSGIVHVVFDHLLERKVAGKFLLTDDGPSSAAVAQLEARAIARLRHPNIVTVHDMGVWEGTPYLLMELLEGATLARELALGSLSSQRAVAICIDVAASLTHAHARGVCHFDLKPGNVHVGDTGIVKLLDFGVGSSCLRSPETRGAPCGTEDSRWGTPGYMSPEQWNLAPLDTRTDVWALGALLYACLTRSLPYDQRQPRHLATAGEPPWAPRLSRRLRLPGSMELVLQKALALDPADRFQSIVEMLVALRSSGAELSCAAPSTSCRCGSAWIASR